MECGERIALVERRPQSRDIELGGSQVALQMRTLGIIDGRVKLDEHVAGLYCLTILHSDGAHDADLEGLDDLGAAALFFFTQRTAYEIDMADARPCQGDAKGGDDRQ